MFKLISKDFKNNDNIPSEFTCDGRNISPHVLWSDAPVETKSFALSLTDPDSPGGLWVHWLVYDLSRDLREIQSGNLPMGAKELENDFGKNSYGGPCPSLGTHRYFFTLYALSLEKIEGITKNNFFEKVKDFTLKKAEIMGYYKKQ